MAENNTNKIVMYLSIVVVVLLVAFVAVVIVFSGGSKTASVTTTTGTGTVSTPTSGTSQPGMAPSAAAFDPATATQVPSSSDPVKFVTTYYQAILDKKWDTAFKMQPAASQVGQTVAAFQQTQEQMYGMTSFKIFASTVAETSATVTVQQELGKNGTWTAIWSFVKDKGTWLVQARKVNMGAPTATK